MLSIFNLLLRREKLLKLYSYEVSRKKLIVNYRIIILDLETLI